MDSQEDFSALLCGSSFLISKGMKTVKIERPFSTYLGYFLLVLFLIQSVVGLESEYIQGLQGDEIYKRWSGLGLTVFILIQWLLTLYRISLKSKSSNALMSIHKWMGALSPLAFFIHSMNWGFQFTLVLSISFFFNFVLGLLNVSAIKLAKPKLYRMWFMTHILLSVAITFLTGLHIFQVFYYE